LIPNPYHKSFPKFHKREEATRLPGILQFMNKYYLTIITSFFKTGTFPGDMIIPTYLTTKNIPESWPNKVSKIPQLHPNNSGTKQTFCI
jgi:hypothetical protein